ncbi:hypothetical protein BKA70DRAFT_1260746 [Coprinopsis sp. MPI-PUGE-AT-0042]|nr:hypothetical protein BKA70DRAFT_1260746 [Coprinopsis sp. MPI-PUGE-AT-0042]
MTPHERKTLRGLLSQVFVTKQEQAQRLAHDILGAEADPIRLKDIMKRAKFKASEADIVVDQLVQEMDDFSTKAEFLCWARAHVFGELQGALEKAKTSQSTAAISLLVYSKMVPKLMRQACDQFSDPNLALFIFKMARYQSVTSYVYGCTTATYNELLAIVWDSFRDLKTIRTTLEDMKANGIWGDRRTEAIVERVCREANEGKLWLDRSSEGDQLATVDLTTISELLMQLLAAGPSKQKFKQRDWKVQATDSKLGHLEFDSW